jgi:maltooligosyltrehalose trehalohydrolase
VVDLAAIAPGRPSPRVPLEKLIFSEIHLGTYSPEGTADGAARLVPELAEAGYTAVEVMPVAAFPGERNWGYDGVALFAAHAAYGGPAGLARFVDAVHAAGLSAFLDVVYNHLGPEGNYLGEFGPYFTSKHKTPWGDALDFSLGPVRRHFVENALRWVTAGGFDGLRLDAVHGIVDDSPRHLLEEIAHAVHAEGKLVIAESDLNDVKLIERYGLDAAWADDLHHALHVALTGESQGYYADYRPPMEALVSALRNGWHFQGQFKPSFKRPHGTKAAHLPGRRFVVAA